jgi:hypothetical protein
MVKYVDIENAFDFVNSDPYANEAVVIPSTGKIFYKSEYADIDDITPEISHLEDSEYVAIPDKKILNIGSNLVFEFVEKNIPNEYNRIRRFFSRRGAYGNYKDFLDEIGKLELWYEFENTRTEQAIREWCADNNIPLED